MVTAGLAAESPVGVVARSWAGEFKGKAGLKVLFVVEYAFCLYLQWGYVYIS